MTTFKWGYNPNSIDVGGRLLVYVEGGTPPFNWVIVDDDSEGFSFFNPLIPPRFVETDSFQRSVEVLALSAAFENSCTIRVTDYTGTSCNGRIKCCSVSCCDRDDYSFSFDSDYPFIVPKVNNLLKIYLLGGCRPFEWSVSGTAFEFAADNTNARWNNLSRVENEDILGTEEITVIDGCDTEINLTVDVTVSEMEMTASNQDGFWSSDDTLSNSSANLLFGGIEVDCNEETGGFLDAIRDGLLSEKCIRTYGCYMCFQNAPFGRGVNIDSAYLLIKSTYSATANVKGHIYCAQHDNPAPPGDISALGSFATHILTQTFPISVGPRKTWNVTDDWTAGEIYQSVDIADCVQSVVDSTGFAAGNSIMVFIDGTGIQTNTDRKYFNSFDGDTAPKLVVAWRS